MIYYLVLTASRGHSMAFFLHKKKTREDDKKEKIIRDIHNDVIETIDKSVHATRKANEQFKKALQVDGGVTLMLFQATRGDNHARR